MTGAPIHRCIACLTPCAGRVCRRCIAWHQFSVAIGRYAAACRMLGRPALPQYTRSERVRRLETEARP
jgi:hypothetical protein